MSNSITGVILSGGEGRRMGGTDKGLQMLNGRPLVAHAMARIAPQVNELILSANRHHEQYALLGYPVVVDTLLANPAGSAAPNAASNAAPDEPSRTTGPLAGLLAGFAAASHALVLFAPCDMPALPADLANRLLDALLSANADVAVAATGGNAHHVVLLAKRHTQTHLAAYVAGGGRKAGAWHAGLKVVTVAFDDEADAFVNVNTVEELARLAGNQASI
jgi:molybdopterin-guanine dinucleotide biosynthesis protein A